MNTATNQSTTVESGARSLSSVLEELGAGPGRWRIDPGGSAVELDARYLFGARVRATMAVTGGQLDVAGDGTITGEVTLDAGTVRTGITMRDRHLRDARHFDVERYPTIAVRIDSVQPGPSSTFVAAGRLTVRDRTIPLELAVDAEPSGDPGFVLTARTEFDRKPLGIPVPLRRTVAARARVHVHRER